jgi:hypothetical protein
MNQLRSQESYIRQRHVQSIEELSQARDEKSEAAQAKVQERVYTHFLNKIIIIGRSRMPLPN